MRLRFTLRASQDIVEIANYIRAENPPAAQRVRTSYLIYYTIDERADEIVVLTVQHPTRQRPMQDE